MKLMNRIIVLFGVMIIASCATKPPEKIQQAPINDVTLAEVAADPKRFVDTPVRWGGSVLKAVEIDEADGQRLQLEIQEYPLGEDGKPIQSATPGARFIAQIYPPYKKDQYFRGRMITVTGLIVGTETYALASGETQELPVISAAEQYAWKEKAEGKGWPYRLWPRFYFHWGSGGRTGVGVIFH